MAQQRPGDWNCATCGNHNFASRQVCNKCGAPPAPGGPASWDAGGNFGGTAAMWDPAAGANTYGYGMVQKGAGKSGGGKGGPYGASGNGAPGSAPRPGDWWCPSCNNHNYADKVACNRCQLPKPVSVQSAQGYYGAAPMGQMQQQQAVWNPYEAGGPQYAPPTYNVGGTQFASQAYQQFGGKGMQQRPGDWTCRACNNLNYANREECNKCKIPKSSFISKTGMRPGDWICPSCQNHNYASKTNCNKCQAPKDDSSVSKVNMREGDWLCPTCGNHNYADKVACNRCQLAKPMT